MIMKKTFKVICGILGTIVVLGIVFFTVDYNRAKNQEKPIFCIQNPAGRIADGGTIEYFGLGYKVIDFHTLAGFDDVKIGSWSMKCDDFKEEMRKYEEKMTQVEYSFCGTITQIEENLFFVKPDENEEIRKSADLIMVQKLKIDTNVKFEIGERIKVTYDGNVLETYPAQINAINYEEISEK